MKKAALIGLLIISLPVSAKNQIEEALEKGMRQSIVGKILKNKANIDIVDTSKRLNKWAEKNRATQ